MRHAWVIGVATLVLAWHARGDEPGKSTRSSRPRTLASSPRASTNGATSSGSNGSRARKYPGVIDQVPFFARGKNITYLPSLAGYTATFPAAVSADGVVVGYVGQATRRRDACRCGTRHSSGMRKPECMGWGCLPTTSSRSPAISGRLSAHQRLFGGRQSRTSLHLGRDGTGWKGTRVAAHLPT